MITYSVTWRGLSWEGREEVKQASLSDGLTESIEIDDAFTAVAIHARDGRLSIVFPFSRVIEAYVNHPERS